MTGSKMRWLVLVKVDESWKYLDRKEEVVELRDDACVWPSLVVAQVVAEMWPEYRLERFDG